MRYIFEEGDKVRILRKAKSYERGWDNSWVSSMDEAVGKVGTVTYVNGRDVGVSVPNAVGIDYGYPDFVLELVVSKMRVLKIKRPADKRTPIKVYGKILGEHGLTYSFAYIVRQGFRGWVCSCESFLLSMFSKKRNCKHLHYVRKEYGRYGSRVSKS